MRRVTHTHDADPTPTTGDGGDAPRWIDYVPVGSIPPADRNPKRHDLDAIRGSFSTYDFTTPALVDERTGHLVAGHGRDEALALHRDRGSAPPQGIRVDPDTGEWLMPVIRGWASHDDDHAAAYLVADNRLTEAGGWDDRMLAELLGDIGDASAALLDATGYTADDIDALVGSLGDDPYDSSDDDGDGDGEGGEGWDDDGPAAAGEAAAAADPDAPNPTLRDRFLVPPFDVLDARGGWWQARKKRWLGLGIRSEIGRSGRATSDPAKRADGPHPGGGGGGAWLGRSADGTSRPHDARYSREEEKGLLMQSASGRDPSYYLQKQEAEKKVGRALTNEEFEAEHYNPSRQYESGTSIFDPVLCELVYRWYSAPGWHVLDPFAGGSVRGLMAGLLGRTYTGNDLSADQVAANQVQADDFTTRGLIDPDTVTWSVGDSADWVTTLESESADLVMTCPPYLWLEKYSDDPADLSTMGTDDFEAVYTRIIAGAAAALRPDRFAVVVVGDVRDPRTSGLVDFRGMTMRAANAAGLHTQSAGVLVTPVGSLAVRAPRQFGASRVLGRTHQDVLVFWKGDKGAAARAMGPVDVTIPDHLREGIDPDTPAPLAEYDGDTDTADDATGPADHMPDLTPVEEHAGVLVKRDDLFTVAGQRGGKVRSCWHLATTAPAGTTTLVTASSRQSPQALIVASIANRLGLACRLHMPAAKGTTPEIDTCRALGADIVEHRPGYNTVIVSRARTDAEDHPDALYIPFGMETPAAVAQTATQAASLAEHAPDRVVIPVGSGMSLAGVLTGMRDLGLTTPVLGVQVGSDPTDRLDTYAPGWRDQVTLVQSEVDYHTHVAHPVLGGLRLDPVYEAKCLPYLQAGDLLWVVGIRATTSNTP